MNIGHWSSVYDEQTFKKKWNYALLPAAVWLQLRYCFASACSPSECMDRANRLARLVMSCFCPRWFNYLRPHLGDVLRSPWISLQLYIAYLGERKHAHPDDVVASHHDVLSTVLGRWALLLTYSTSIPLSASGLVWGVLFWTSPNNPTTEQKSY